MVKDEEEKEKGAVFSSNHRRLNSVVEKEKGVIFSSNHRGLNSVVEKREKVEEKEKEEMGSYLSLIHI